VPPWPRAAQLALVFLLGVATTLLAVHSLRGLRWGSRPTELEPGAISAYRIDLNHANRAELLQLQGVGETLANRIVQHREQHGAFQDVGDLRQVQGIGPTKLEQLRPRVTVQPTATDDAAESPPLIKERASPQGSSKKEAQLTHPIDINRATAAELQRLPAVGPKRAQQILEERQKRPFASVDELRRVSGIGPKTLERLRPYVVVESSPMRVLTAGGP
jgi:competence protein ComEA